MSLKTRQPAASHRETYVLTSLFGSEAIDRELDDLNVVEYDFDDRVESDPGNFNFPSRLKDRELNRTLAILDEIENNKEGGQA